MGDKGLPKDIARRVEDLPDGVVVSDIWSAKGRREGARWFFRVRDPLGRDAKGRPRYVAKTWADFDAGVTWALDEHARLRLGMSTSTGAKLSEIGPAHVKALESRGQSETHQAKVRYVYTSLIAAGADNMKDEHFHLRVERWLSGLRAKRKGQKTDTPASARTKNQYLTIVRTLCNLAMAQRALAYNPLAPLKRWPEERGGKRVFTVAELRKLVSDDARMARQPDYDETVAALAAAGDDKQVAAKALGVHLSTVYNRLEAGPQGEDPWWLYCVLGIYTGCRPTEVRALRWEHVDWHSGDILLPTDHPGNKTRVERRIPMMAELREVLEARFHVGARGPILAAEIADAREDVATRGYQRFVERCGVDAKGRGPHTLRHNCGALLTACGVQDVAVLLHLGHESVGVSKEYRRSAPAFRNDVATWGKEIRLRTSSAATQQPERKRARSR